MKYHLKFNTQHNQFYLADMKSPKKTDELNFWSNEAYEDRLAIGKGVLGIGTESYGNINAEIVLLDRPNNDFNKNNFDHIVEGGIQCESGQLEILDCPTNNKQLQIKIDPGYYRIRVYSSNLESVEGDEGKDYYKVEIWPDSNMERKVLKQYDSK